MLRAQVVPSYGLDQRKVQAQSLNTTFLLQRRPTQNPRETLSLRDGMSVDEGESKLRKVPSELVIKTKIST